MSTDIPPRRETDRPVYESDATRPLAPAEREQAISTDDRDRAVAEERRIHDDPRTHDDRGIHDDRGVYDDRRVADDRRVYDNPPAGAGVPIADGRSLRHEVHAREKEKFGGFQFGAAFFGWLAAMGLALLLTALVATIGGAVGLASPETVDDAANAAADNWGAATIIGAIVVALVLFLSYFAGGYVAGRMARFSGLKQGLAVWLWAILIAVLVALITAIAGSQWDVLANLDAFPRIPVSPETATLTGILTAVGAAVVTLAGALLGGIAGERYHRRVDRVGFGA